MTYMVISLYIHAYIEKRIHKDKVDRAGETTIQLDQQALQLGEGM